MLVCKKHLKGKVLCSLLCVQQRKSLMILLEVVSSPLIKQYNKKRYPSGYLFLLELITHLLNRISPCFKALFSLRLLIGGGVNLYCTFKDIFQIICNTICGLNSSNHQIISIHFGKINRVIIEIYELC